MLQTENSHNLQNMSHKGHINDRNADVEIQLENPGTLEVKRNLCQVSHSLSYPSTITPKQGICHNNSKMVSSICSHPSRLERRRRGVENLKKNFFLCSDASASPVHQCSSPLKFKIDGRGVYNHVLPKSPDSIAKKDLKFHDPSTNKIFGESLNDRLGPIITCLNQRCTTDAQNFSQPNAYKNILTPFLNFNNNNSNVDETKTTITRPTMQPVNSLNHSPTPDNPTSTNIINSHSFTVSTNPHTAQSHMLPNSITNGLASDSHTSPDVPLMASNHSTTAQPLVKNKTKHLLSKRKSSSSLKGDNVSFTMISRPTDYYGTKHKRRPLYLCFLASLLLLFAAAIAALTYALIYKSKYTHALKKIEKSEKTCYTPECISIAAMLLEGIDKKADPCNDFYQFACGTWNKLHTIPEDRSSISTFEVLSSKLQIALKSLLEEDEESDDLMAINQAKALYKSCANNTEAEIVGDGPLMNTLQDLGGWPILNTSWDPSNFSMEIMMARLFMYNTPAFLEILVGPDDKNSSINILQMDQNSLVLPSREYYLNPNNNLILKAYKRLVYTIALLMGASGPQVKAEAEEIVNLEVDIALASVPSADRHDASAIYQKLSFRRLSKIVPQFDWMKFIRHIPNAFVINDTEPIVIYSEPFLRMLGQIVKVTPPRKLANYALWRHVNAFLPHLPQRYADALFAFRKVIYGVSAPIIKWQQCVEYVADHMGMPVGAMFVREHFRNGSKETALEMIHDIRSAFNELLHTNKWMDNETRKVAEEKANAMNELIGYPESIFDEEELNKEYPEVNTTTNFLTNVISIGTHEFSKNFAELRKPVNKDGWGTGPAVVNAFYSPNKNNIVIPAGILQPLFYSETFPKSLNFGGIGVVIGHEITHGFDEKGRQFDKDGNLKQWWNNATIRAFRGRAQCIIDQYSSYKLKEIDMNINGRNTQGENIADNGGLKQAFRAYKKWVEKHGPEQLLPGIDLTHDQLFFLNYAQIWCGSMRPEEAVNKIHSSVHSPGPIRVLGPLSNSYDFANAYNCPAGSKMNPTHKCSVW